MREKALKLNPDEQAPRAWPPSAQAVLGHSSVGSEQGPVVMAALPPVPSPLSSGTQLSLVCSEFLQSQAGGPLSPLTLLLILLFSLLSLLSGRGQAMRAVGVRVLASGLRSHSSTSSPGGPTPAPQVLGPTPVPQILGSHSCTSDPGGPSPAPQVLGVPLPHLKSWVPLLRLRSWDPTPAPQVLGVQLLHLRSWGSHSGTSGPGGSHSCASGPRSGP